MNNPQDADPLAFDPVEGPPIEGPLPGLSTRRRDPVKPQGRSKGGLVLSLLAFGVIAGAGGWYYYQGTPTCSIHKLQGALKAKDSELIAHYFDESEFVEETVAAEVMGTIKSVAGSGDNLIEELRAFKNDPSSVELVGEIGRLERECRRFARAEITSLRSGLERNSNPKSVQMIGNDAAEAEIDASWGTSSEPNKPLKVILVRGSSRDWKLSRFARGLHGR